MISFLEMAQKYPIGKKINLPTERDENQKDDAKQEKKALQEKVPQVLKEITGYEYYNGTGYLLFGNDDKMRVDG